MRVFLAGATGAVGRPMVRELLAAGHEVVAATRWADRMETLRAAGAEPVVCDALEAAATREALVAARPDAVVHQLTALPRRINPRKIVRDLAATNRLRTEGTRNLMDAALAAGASRFVAQSVAFVYEPTGEGLKTETDPMFLDAPATVRPLLDAIRELETITTTTDGIEGLVLRYGYFYGAGTVYAHDGSFTEDVKKRKVPLVGAATGVYSFIHVDDAARAAVAALEHGDSGIYNVTDDDPAPVSEWLPVFAETIGAPRPFRIPEFLGRLAAGPYAAYVMVHQRGVSNARAKQALDWAPELASWRTGFRQSLG